MAQTGFPSRSANATVYRLVIDSQPTAVCVSNATKDSWILRNEGNCDIYLKYGPLCSTDVFTQRIAPHAIFADNYGGLMTGCVAPGNSGLLLVTLKL